MAGPRGGKVKEEEGWRHGNSRLAFNVPCGVPRIPARSQRVRRETLEEGPGQWKLFSSRRPSFVQTVIDEKVTKKERRRERERRKRRGRERKREFDRTQEERERKRDRQADSAWRASA